MAILVLVVGSLGAATAETLSHTGGDAGAGHGTVQLTHSHPKLPPSLGAVASRPWMW